MWREGAASAGALDSVQGLRLPRPCFMADFRRCAEEVTYAETRRVPWVRSANGQWRGSGNELGNALKGDFHKINEGEEQENGAFF